MARERTESTIPRLVLFDLDRTVIRGSSERAFVRYLYDEGILEARDVGRWLGVALADLRAGNWDGLRANRAYLAGCRASIIGTAATRFVETVLARRVFPAAREAIEGHRRCGDTLVLLSGSLDVLAAAMARRLGIPTFVASVLEARKGVYTGRLVGLHPRGVHKVALAERIGREHGIELERAVAYADHTSDRFLLERVGKAIVVNPRRAFRREAERRGWQIVHWAVER